MAHAHARADRRLRHVDEPVEVARRDLALEKLFPQRKLDGIMNGIDARDIDLSPVDKAAFALPDGIAENALVPSDDLAVQDKIARTRERAPLCDPVYIILIRHEADLHAVRLVRCGKSKALRQRAHFFFLVPAQRQHDARDLLAPQTAEHIALVVGGAALVERSVFNARIVTGRDLFGADAVGLGEQRAEFYRRVAEDAGIGCLAAQVALAKRRAHLLVQLLPDVKHRQLDAHARGGLDRLKARLFIRVVEIQPVHLIARLLQQHGRHGGVDPAGKTENDLAHIFVSI